MSYYQTLHTRYNVSRETYERLEAFATLFNHWEKSINLVSHSDKDSLWERHIADSIRLLNHIPEDTKIINDFGSGGGFPGLILAIIRPWKVHLIESNHKKCAFLRTVSAELNLNTAIHTNRIETLTPWPSDVVTARALAPLSKLCTLLEPFIACTKTTLFFKGDTLMKEVSDAQQEWQFNYEIHQDTTESGPIIALNQLSRRIAS